MSLQLNGKVAIVTGGGSGIGRGISIELAKHGADVAVCDLFLDKAQETCNSLNKKVQNTAIKADVTNKEEVQYMVKEAINKFGKIDILCNNAGISLIKDTIELDEKDWDAHMNVNAKGVFLCSKEVACEMIKRQKGGRIINTASYLGKIGAGGLAHYCASKFAVIGFTQCLAIELGKYNITVNAVCPGDVDTPMMEREWKLHAFNNDTTSEEEKEKNRKRMLLGRLEKPQDVAKLVVFLASDYADYITAESINVSGGLPFTARE